MVVYMLEQRWEILRQIALQKMPIMAQKKSSFQMKFILILSKLSHLGHRQPARLHWKADAPKTLDYLLWGVVKDRCYADKPETIDAIKNNNREAIGEIQLHTIDNVLKNWTDRVGYSMVSQCSHLNEIIFHY